MSTRRLLARLDRLEKMPKPIVVGGDFRIDPALAKALRDEQRRFDELSNARQDQMLCDVVADIPGHDAGPSEEESMLSARIDRLLDTIVCPPSYGAWQARKDVELLLRRYDKPPQTAAEDAEHAQLTARVVAFRRTPEGRCRDRIGDLNLKKMFSFRRGLSAAEQNELDHLRTLYPDLPLDPDIFMHQVLIEIEQSEAKKRALEVEARKHAQENCAAVESCNDGVSVAMKDSDDLACFFGDGLGTRKRAWNDDFDKLQVFLGAIGNMYVRKQLSPPFLLKEYATRWIADGIPLAHCAEQFRKHLDNCSHQYRVGSGDKGISWVDHLIRTTGQSSNLQLGGVL
jgi:hypothetical protein